MKRRIWICTGLSFLIFLGSCVSNNVLADAHAADNNVNRLSRISLRMNEEEVLSIMHAPYDKETYRVGADRYDVWFYVTTVTVLGQSRMVPKNLTPLTFRNKQLVGVGYDYYHWVQKREPVRPRPARVTPGSEDKELEQQLKKAFAPDSTTAPQNKQPSGAVITPSKQSQSSQPVSQPKPAAQQPSDLKLGPPPYVPPSRPKTEEPPATQPAPVTQSEVEIVNPGESEASLNSPPGAPAVPPQQPQPAHPKPNQPPQPIQPNQPPSNTPPPTYDPQRPTSHEPFLHETIEEPSTSAASENLETFTKRETGQLDHIGAPQPAQPNQPSPRSPDRPAIPPSHQQPNQPVRPQQAPNQTPSNTPTDLHHNPAPYAPPNSPPPAQESTMSRRPDQSSDQSDKSEEKKSQTHSNSENPDPQKKPKWDEKDAQINEDAMDQDFNYW